MCPVISFDFDAIDNERTDNERTETLDPWLTKPPTLPFPHAWDYLQRACAVNRQQRGLLAADIPAAAKATGAAGHFRPYFQSPESAGKPPPIDRLGELGHPCPLWPLGLVRVTRLRR